MKGDSIAFVITEYLGLPETFIYEEIKNLDRFRPVVLTHNVINYDLFPLDNIINLKEGLWKINDPNQGVAESFTGKIKNMKHYFFAHNYFKKLIKKENISIIHAQYGSDGVYSIPLKEKFNLPLVTSFRGLDASKAPKQNPGIYNELFKKGDIFLVRCNSMKKDLILLGCPEDKIIVHHSSIDLEKFPYVKRKSISSTSTVKILFVGRLVEKKGILDAVTVLKKILNKKYNVQMTIIGDGHLKEKSIKLADTLGVLDKITFKGFLSPNKIPNEMKKHHIFFLPCKTPMDEDKEGIPNSLMEAQASGMPVVSTLHSGVPEAVLDGETGYLVTEGDTDSMAERIIYLIEHPEVSARLGACGRKHIEKEFNILAQTKKLESIYDGLI